MADDSDDEFDHGDFGSMGRKDADDDDFGESYDDYEESDGDRSEDGDSRDGRSKVVKNKPYDEVLEADESGDFEESVDTLAGSRGGAAMGRGGGGGGDAAGVGGGARGGGGGGGMRRGGVDDDEDDDDLEDDEDEDEDDDEDYTDDDGEEDDEDDLGDDGRPPIPPGGYDPADYEGLDVEKSIKDLFLYVRRYTPTTMEIETKLKCFIPAYIPAVGDIDAFIKLPRPDGKDDGLGLRVLDEPSSSQSDPTVLELQLRAISKDPRAGPEIVRSIEGADRENKGEIDRWIASVEELHATKPAPRVSYTKTMPAVSRLMMMQWPEEMEEVLKSVRLPSAELNLDLAEYVQVLCAILDIPVYTNMIESLHLLFTLYSNIKSHPQYQALVAGKPAGADSFTLGATEVGEGPGLGSADVDRLELM
eukprot:PLAT4757.1.p2 GENE.PLAT4757.1~~PLAT4757.1.p2  ORF type:complete len:419 (+),score=223.91 PLAT4757.1:76-1332(+)